MVDTPNTVGRRTRPPSLGLRRLFVFLLLFFAPTAFAGDLLLIQGSKAPFLDEVTQAFRRIYENGGTLGPKQLRGGSLVFVDLAGEDQGWTPSEPALRRVSLIVAVGTRALAAVRGVTNTPIIHLAVPASGSSGERRSSGGGVSIDLDTTTFLKGLLQVAPAVRRVGVVHDAKREEDWTRDAATAASRLGVTLVFRAVRTAAETPAALDSLRGKVDALWMQPDLAVTSPESAKAMVLFSLEQHVPLLTFSEKFLPLGATVSVTADPLEIAERGAAMALELLADRAPRAGYSARLERALVKVNPTVADKLGLVRQPGR